MSDDRTISRATRKARIGMAGGVTVALGVVLLPLPGPGSLVILAGLTVLGREFPAAKRLADRGWRGFGRLMHPLRRRNDS